VSVHDELEVVVVDDRAGFYMVPTAAIGKARARLSGAHLTEALAGLVCLARASFAQHGASREEHQALEANLDELATGILGVSRARALRIVDHLAEAGAVSKDAHRRDGTRRLPTRIEFADLAHSFAYVSGPAFRALRTHSRNGGPPLGPLALYVTLVALAGEQRHEFPDGNRRVARASQPELAKLSGLSISSVKRAIALLVDAGLVSEQPQPAHTMKTKLVYRLIDPADPAATTVIIPAREGSHTDRPTSHNGTDVRPYAHPSTAHTGTLACPRPDRPSAHSPTNDGSGGDGAPGPGATDRQAGDRARAHGNERKSPTEDQSTQIPICEDRLGPADGGEVGGSEVEQLVEAFRAWTGRALGERRAAALYDRDTWVRTAIELLGQYELERLLAGIDRLGRDALLADKGTTLPAFAQIADRAIARAAADRALAEHRATSTCATGAPAWASAHALLRQAVSAFGRGGENRALAFLEEQEPFVAAFARDVGWRTLARSDDSMNDIKFAYLTFRHSSATPEAA